MNFYLKDIYKEFRIKLNFNNNLTWHTSHKKKSNISPTIYKVIFWIITRCNFQILQTLSFKLQLLEWFHQEIWSNVLSLLNYLNIQMLLVNSNNSSRNQYLHKNSFLIKFLQIVSQIISITFHPITNLNKFSKVKNLRRNGYLIKIKNIIAAQKQLIRLSLVVKDILIILVHSKNNSPKSHQFKILKL